jgi:hypothetical protein
MGPYFVRHKGVRQGWGGGGFSPVLFNFPVVVLNRMVVSAQNHGLVIGLIDNLITHGIAIL